ncbi:DNA repair protein RAD50-like isoform X2 [Hydractinia symbiolongicarpus]|uniref:DNA repair protein RAD50-like isoform X2 n=1 Tax=Hydractinia symbiolongicarpus TaxID=13093 RepID=UPI00254E4970|nr:DNA repair protein RAD50-like isoform X2 [Hydractinia symbiolongicarpus]
MAMIHKMKIMGIRSYSPEGSVIEFQTPLTIIVGHNGTGKTSVIESLSYVITGGLPPGCKNQAFVHDPKLAGKKEVKGQVKLVFTDITGNKLTGQRSLISTVKDKKVETKSMDGVIVKRTANGERASTNCRATDFSREMISRLGVSKAVLENVIFCHQEEANWPLSVGKVLKQKFDAIFAATRYIKALESIRNVRKEQGKEVEKYDAELVYLEQNKEKAKEITQELEKAELQVAASKKKIKKIKTSSKPYEAKLAELSSISQEIADIGKRIETNQITKDQLLKNVAELKNKIVNKFQGTYKKLKETALKHESTLEKRQIKLESLESMSNILCKEMDKLAKTRMNLREESVKLQQEAETQQKYVKSRDRYIKNFSNEYDVQGFESGQYSPEEVDLFLKRLEEIHTVMESEGKKTQELDNSKIDKVETSIGQLEKSLHRHEGIIEQKQKLIESNTTKLLSINDSLNSLATSENSLQNIEKKLEKATTNLEDFENKFNSSQVKDEVNDLMTRKKKEDAILNQLREKEDIMIQQSKSQTKVDMLNNNKADKEDTIQEILRKHKESLESIFVSCPPASELKKKLEEFLQSEHSKLLQASQQYDKIIQSITEKETEKKMLREEIQKKEEKMSESKAKIHQTCAENDYNEFRELVQKRTEKYSSALFEIDAFERIYEKYIQQLQDDEVKEKGCPLCHRKFVLQNSVKELVEELSNKLIHVPEKRNKNQIALDKERKLNEKLMDLAPVKSVVDTLLNELPLFKEKVGDLTKEIEKERQNLTKIELTKNLAETALKIARSMESDMSVLDNHLSQIQDFDIQLNLENSKLSGVTSGKTMQSLREEVQVKQSQVDHLSQNIGQKNDQLMEYEKQLSLQNKSINELTSQKLSLQSELQQSLQLQKQKEEISSAVQAYKKEIKQATGQIRPLNARIKKELKKKKQVILKKEENEKVTRDKLERIRNYKTSISSYTKDINKFITSGKGTAVDDKNEEIEIIEQQLKQKKNELREKTSEIDSIREELSQKELRKRELDDNIQLIETNKEIQKLDDSIKELENQLSEYGVHQNVVDEYSTCQQILNEHHKDCANLEGQLKGFEDEVSRCKRELNSSLYENAEKKHCDMKIDIRTTELVNKDLDKYYKALDKAIMKYHSLKLKEINKIIKEYWMKTYKGYDIDTIEVVAEDDDDGSGASKARRSYNYRVCMIKSDKYLDMKSRCSAGQKVLASIIIRLALAETFCLNCGILALDEPTTNLDEENIASLASSLRDIIEVRRQQRNFQLLIITHNEEFVQALGRSDFVEYYFRVYKDEEGYSRIHKLRMVDKE